MTTYQQNIIRYTRYQSRRLRYMGDTEQYRKGVSDLEKHITEFCELERRKRWQVLRKIKHRSHEGSFVSAILKGKPA